MGKSITINIIVKTTLKILIILIVVANRGLKSNGTFPNINKPRRKTINKPKSHNKLLPYKKYESAINITWAECNLYFQYNCAGWYNLSMDRSNINPKRISTPLGKLKIKRSINVKPKSKEKERILRLNHDFFYV